MDDFTISNLHLSRDEWCARLVTILTPLVIEGVKSIFNEAWSMCVTNEEPGKYLMTFQTLLCRVPKWSPVIIEEERKRIIEKSGCNYLEDLITCVHIIQLKVLTCIRVGNKQKKIDISIPKLDTFLHRTYINTARKFYTNVYLFERGISPLLAQKNSREMELIIQECILTTIRESIPTEAIIRAYMEEAVEQEEEVIMEEVPEEPPTMTEEEHMAAEREENAALKKKLESHLESERPPDMVPTISNINDEPVKMSLSFNDYDHVKMDNGETSKVEAPKTIERLERLSTERAMQRRMDDSDDDGDEMEKLTILSDDGEDLMGDLGIVDVSTNSGKEEELSLDFMQV